MGGGELHIWNRLHTWKQNIIVPGRIDRDDVTPNISRGSLLPEQDCYLEKGRGEGKIGGRWSENKRKLSAPPFRGLERNMRPGGTRRIAKRRKGNILLLFLKTFSSSKRRNRVSFSPPFDFYFSLVSDFHMFSIEYSHALAGFQI